MTISYKRGDVVVVPFSFIDSSIAKRRPALVVSGSEYNGKSGALICAMLTSATQVPWPGDVKLRKWSQAGLKRECSFRLKLFTIEQNLVREVVGVASDSDMLLIDKQLTKHLGLPSPGAPRS